MNDPIKHLEPAGPAPKLTPEHVAAQVVSVQYLRFPGTTVTVCCVTLRNGYNTIGHSACVSPENFDAAIGEQIAYKNALNEIWQLEGYLLAEWLCVQRVPQQDCYDKQVEREFGSLGEPVWDNAAPSNDTAPTSDPV
jgi:hypothetical protein